MEINLLILYLEINQIVQEEKKIIFWYWNCYYVVF